MIYLHYLFSSPEGNKELSKRKINKKEERKLTFFLSIILIIFFLSIVFFILFYLLKNSSSLHLLSSKKIAPEIKPTTMESEIRMRFSSIAEMKANFLNFPENTESIPLEQNGSDIKENKGIWGYMEEDVANNKIKILNPNTKEELLYDNKNSNRGGCCEQATTHIFLDKETNEYWIWYYQASISNKTEGWFGPFILE